MLAIEEKENHHRLKLSEILKPKLTDLIILIVSLIPPFFFYFQSISKRSFHVFSTCDSGYLNLLMAKLMYTNNKDFDGYFKKNKLANYYCFPLYPILYRIFYYLCFKSWKIATVAIVVTLSFFCNFFFYRFLICIKNFKNPLLSTLIFSVFPIRSLYLRNVTNAHTLFLLLFELIYIFQQTRSFKLLAVSSFLMIFTNDYGALIVLGFLISSILLRNKKEFKYIFFCYLAGLITLSIFHKSISGRFFPIVGDFLIDRRYPFKELIKESHSIGRLRQLHGIYNYYIIPLFACLLTIPIDKSIGIPLLLSFLYSASKFGRDGVDSACSIASIAILIGFDVLIKHPRFKNSLYIIAPFYVISVFYLTLQIYNSRKNMNSYQFNAYTMK